MTKQDTLNVLLITSSAREQGSVTRRFANEVLDKWQDEYAQINLVERDVASGLPFVDADWLSANFTPAEQRNATQQQVLALSDQLVDELEQADVLLLAVPVYNFSVPASFKAWIDMVARVGRTFRYTSNGPVGLLQNKKACAVMATGGTQFGSDIDYASGYLKHILGFIGIEDVSFIFAERFADDEQNVQAVQQQIQERAGLMA